MLLRRAVVVECNCHTSTHTACCRRVCQWRPHAPNIVGKIDTQHSAAMGKSIAVDIEFPLADGAVSGCLCAWVCAVCRVNYELDKYRDRWWNVHIENWLQCIECFYEQKYRNQRLFDKCRYNTIMICCGNHIGSTVYRNVRYKFVCIWFFILIVYYSHWNVECNISVELCYIQPV